MWVVVCVVKGRSACSTLLGDAFLQLFWPEPLSPGALRTASQLIYWRCVYYLYNIWRCVLNKLICAVIRKGRYVPHSRYALVFIYNLILYIGISASCVECCYRWEESTKRLLFGWSFRRSLCETTSSALVYFLSKGFFIVYE